MSALVLVALLGSASAQCSGIMSVLTGSNGSVIAPAEFLTADCQWNIQTDTARFIEITFTDFFIDTQPPFCQDTPGFPLVSSSTDEYFACAQLNAFCSQDVVRDFCPEVCYLCDSCSYNYLTVTGKDGVKYFHDCQNIATPLVVDAFSDNVFITSTRSFFARGQGFGTSEDRLAFTWRAVLTANHTHPTTGCSGIKYLSEDNGTFTDGSPPSASYKPNANCQWVITAPPDMYVELTFDAFELQRASTIDLSSTFARCVQDKVSIVDARSLVGEYCGTNTPPVVTSSGQNLTVIFTSDPSVERTGFTASYRFVANGSEPASRCASYVVFDQQPGEANVVSGASALACSWNIIPPASKYVQITFLEHSLVPLQPSCVGDYIYIMQGSKFLQKSCDEYLPPPVTGTLSGPAGALNVSFVASSMILEYFHFTWSFVDIPGVDPVTCTSNMQISAPVGGTGTISDGTRYGIAYLPDLDCSWTITAPTNYLLHFDYTYFSIENDFACGFDSLSVYSGVNGTTRLQRVCGVNLPNHVQSTTNKLVVKFHSDPLVNYDGFSAVWSVIPQNLFTPCGGLQIIDATVALSGNITDNSGGYASLMNCSWVINTLPNKFIQIEVLRITLFPREVGYDICYEEYLAAWDGSSPSSYMLFKSCGEENPGVQVSTSSSLYVRYSSAAQIRNGGFLIRWTVVDNPGTTTDRACFGLQQLPANPEDMNGTIVNYRRGETYRPDSNCLYLITAPKNQYIQITWEDFSLEGKDFLRRCYDYVSVIDGNQTGGYELQRSCGRYIPLKVTSIQNQILLQFVSNAATQYYGFIASWQVVDQPGTLTCNGVKNIFRSPPSGFISDGARGLGYTNNANCVWKIEAPADLVISIKFIELQLEVPFAAVCQDYVQFVESAQTHPRICGVLTQNLLDANAFTSQTNQLELHFISDANNAGPGFNISYQFVPPPPQGEDNSSKVELIVAVVLLTFFGIVLFCCGFVYWRKRQAAKAIEHINLDRGQDLNRNRTVSGTAPLPCNTAEDMETTGPTPI